MEARAAELLVVFCSEHPAGSELLAGVWDGARGGRIIGCTAPMFFSNHGVQEEGVVVLALGGDDLRVATAGARLNDPRAAGRAVAESLVNAVGRTHPELCILLTAALAGDQDEIVRGAYGGLGGAVALVGGATGDYPDVGSTRQFHDDEVLVDAVVGAALSCGGPVGIGVNHGFIPHGEPMLVTRSEREVVLELDGRPALDAYLEALDAPAEAGEDLDAFRTFALPHPLVLGRRLGLPPARCVSAADFERRAITCIAEVPQSALVWAAQSDREASLRAADKACRQALAGLNGHPPRALLVFDCIGRRNLLEEPGGRQEMEIFAQAAGGAPWAGFFSYGEIARIRGLSGFHNKAVVVLAIG